MLINKMREVECDERRLLGEDVLSRTLVRGEVRENELK